MVIPLLLAKGEQGLKYGRLVRRFDEANREIDLKGVDNKIRGGMQMFSTIAFLNAGNLNDQSSEFIAAANLVAVVSLHMRDGNWRQAASHGAYALAGRAVIGGNAHPFKEDGVGGIWISGVDGEAYLREDLPEGKAHPEGLFKDVSAEHGPHGLGSPLQKYRAGNVKLADQLTRLFDLHDVRKSTGTLLEENKLVPPRFWVMPDDGRVEPRWRNVDDPEYEQALTMIDEIVARRTRDAAWAIPGLPDSVTADCSAKVADVKGDRVVLKHMDGSTERSAPVESVRWFINELTGYDAADLQLTPIVSRGQVVGPNTPLFGPVKPDLKSSVMRLRACVANSDGDAAHLASRQLTLLRLYALAAEGRQLPSGHIAYPVELTVPKSTRYLFAQVAGKGWDVRVQRVRLMRNPETALVARGLGCTVDLFTTSQRKRSEQQLAAKRNKRAAEAAQRAAKKAESESREAAEAKE